MSFLMSKIAETVEGVFLGEDLSIDKICTPEELKPGGLVIVMEDKYLDRIPKNYPVIGSVGRLDNYNVRIEVDNVRLAMAKALSLFDDSDVGLSGGHHSASISPSAHVDDSAYIGPMCIVEDGAFVESGAVLRGNVFLGRKSRVGAGSVVEPGVVIYRGCSIGRDCLIHGNVVVGADGFGQIPAQDGDKVVKVPQIGGVLIGDRVEIGASTTVDRGTISDTVIDDDTKVDNQVQIGHNVKIGKNCIIVAMSGIGGSAVLEDGVVMAARSSVKDHVKVGSGAVVAGMAGATKDVKLGSVVSGFPARDHRDDFRVQALVRRLPELFKKVKKLESKI